MGSISAGIGLISGIDSATLIEQLLSLDARQKTPIFQKLGGLGASKTALLDINARLLNLKSAARSFRFDNVFSSSLANSSNESVLSAIAGSNAVPGTYNFTVKQLVSTSQRMSGGYSSSNLVPLQLDQMSFEFGQGGLARDVQLSSLRGGAGVQRGSIRITDKDGSESVIDLSLATSVNDVIEIINSEEGVLVEASIDANRLVIKDKSGGTGDLSVTNADGLTTAEDLGIYGVSSSSELIGSAIHTLGLGSFISEMNDGNGVFIRDNVTDFSIQVGSEVFDIDLGRVDAQIIDSTLLSELNDGDGIAINGTSGQPDFSIRTSTGVDVQIELGEILDENGEVDEAEVSTVQQFLRRTNSALEDVLGPGQVVVSISQTGSGFVITDNLEGGGNLEVEGAGPYGEDAARDLGIFTGEGGGDGNVIVGSTVPTTVQTPRVATIEDLFERISSQTGGVVVGGVNADNTGITLSSPGDFVTVLGGAIDGSSFASEVANQTLSDLGFEVGATGIILGGDRILGGMGSVQLSTIHGGQGIGTASTMSFTDRQGDSLTLTNLNSFQTLDRLISHVNDELADSNVDISLRINDEGNGLFLEEQTLGTGNMIVSGDLSEALEINVNIGSNSHRGGNLQRKYVGFSTPLSELNYGRGIGVGKFSITDSGGNRATIDIGSDASSLYDIINEINSRGIDVEARVNTNGDGIILVDTNEGTPISAMRVDSVNGTTANDLGILGVASGPGQDINGSYEKVVDLDVTDTLEEVIGKINDSGIEVTASLLNTGTGGTPYRMVLSSGITGLDGDLFIDTGSVNLELTELTQARNAKVFIGEGENAVLVESTTNTIDNILAGISLDLHSADNQPVTVSVNRDDASVLESIQRFVTTFNDVISRINEYDSYDSESESRGPLLGDPTVSRIRGDLYRTVQQKAVGIDTEYSFLFEVGIKVGKNGELTFDEDQFKEAYENNPSAVENLFAAYESSGSTTQTISPGVTVSESSTTYTSRGFGDLFDDAVEKLTNSVDGTVTYADKRFQELIDAANSRIERIDERLETKRVRLQRQFVAMETALARLQSQQGALGMINQNLLNAQSMM